MKTNDKVNAWIRRQAGYTVPDPEAEAKARAEAEVDAEVRRLEALAKPGRVNEVIRRLAGRRER